MKKLILLHIILILLIHCMFIGNCYAQNKVFHFIRSYNNTLTLTYDKEQFNSFFFNEYGWLQYGNVSEFRYLYAAQEYDSELNIHFFRSRLYNSTSKVFYQPDPKSQYHSSYSYVNGDPVNYIDTDGKMGKPLILYSEKLVGSESMEVTTRDFLDAVPDSYQYPLSSFVNGEIPDLPEWNGNVFIKSHMSTERGSELVLEDAWDKYLLKTRSPIVRRKYIGEGSYRNFFDGEMMGSMLRKFSEERGVPIKNITAGGCEGSHAASSMKRGYIHSSSSSFAGKLGSREIKFAGLNKGKSTMYVGNKGINNFMTVESVNIQETKLYIAGTTEEFRPHFKQNWRKQLKFKGMIEKVDSENQWKLLPSTDEAGIQSFVNGRIPDNLAKDFTIIISKY